jgi:hypothetical protein
MQAEGGRMRKGRREEETEGRRDGETKRWGEEEKGRNSINGQKCGGF